MIRENVFLNSSLGGPLINIQGADNVNS
jgi:hypothetical protein